MNLIPAAEGSSPSIIARLIQQEDSEMFHMFFFMQRLYNSEECKKKIKNLNLNISIGQWIAFN